MSVKVGNLRRLSPEMLECFIANTIRNNSPGLYDRLTDEGLVFEWLPSAWVPAESAEIVMDFRISSANEAETFIDLSKSIGKLIAYCTTEKECVLATSLRYIQADINQELYRFSGESQLDLASGQD